MVVIETMQNAGNSIGHAAAIYIELDDSPHVVAGTST
jgi:hypothetical protein